MNDDWLKNPDKPQQAPSKCANTPSMGPMPMPIPIPIPVPIPAPKWHLWGGIVGFNTAAIFVAVILRYSVLGISEGYAEFVMWWMTLGVSGPLIFFGISYFFHKPSIPGIRIEEIKIEKFKK